MTGWPPSGWCRDEQDRLVLFNIPQQVSFDNVKKCPSSPILHLPLELHHSIAWHLHPVDRVCLALTCKTLALSLLSAPRLSPTNWSRFSDRRYDWLVPESYSLILRLAHGWIPKTTLRYCWKCHKILPRDEAYFRKRMSCKTTPKWSVKVGMPKHEWQELPRRKRYDHLLRTWCHATTEDSSCLYCDHCREANVAHVKEGNHPVECPVCLEKELTFVWRPPRNNRARLRALKLLKDVCRPLANVVFFLVLVFAFAAEWLYEVVGTGLRSLKRRWEMRKWTTMAAS